MVLQNAGIIPKIIGTKNGTQTVYVKGGNIDADVSGSVSVDNTVDINIEAVNGHANAFYGPSKMEAMMLCMYTQGNKTPYNNVLLKVGLIPLVPQGTSCAEFNPIVVEGTSLLAKNECQDNLKV